jgi:hypothetical protein
VVEITEIRNVGFKRFRVWFKTPRRSEEVYQDINASDELSAYLAFKKYQGSLTTAGTTGVRNG